MRRRPAHEYSRAMRIADIAQAGDYGEERRGESTSSEAAVRITSGESDAESDADDDDEAESGEEGRST